MIKVYLAGPITGLKVNDANDWRVSPSGHLRAMGMVPVDPLRSEPPGIDGTYMGTYADIKYGTAKAIASKNLLDVKSADVVLAYMPQYLNPDWPSVGTLAELFIAHALGKPTILVTDEPRLLKHPLVQAASSWILPTLDDAMELIQGTWGVYVD